MRRTSNAVQRRRARKDTPLDPPPVEKTQIDIPAPVPVLSSADQVREFYRTRGQIDPCTPRDAAAFRRVRPFLFTRRGRLGQKRTSKRCRPPSRDDWLNALFVRDLPQTELLRQVPYYLQSAQILRKVEVEGDPPAESMKPNMKVVSDMIAEAAEAERKRVEEECKKAVADLEARQQKNKSDRIRTPSPMTKRATSSFRDFSGNSTARSNLSSAPMGIRARRPSNLEATTLNSARPSLSASIALDAPPNESQPPSPSPGASPRRGTPSLGSEKLRVSGSQHTSKDSLSTLGSRLGNLSSARKSNEEHRRLPPRQPSRQSGASSRSSLQRSPLAPARRSKTTTKSSQDSQKMSATSKEEHHSQPESHIDSAEIISRLRAARSSSVQTGSSKR